MPSVREHIAHWSAILLARTERMQQLGVTYKLNLEGNDGGIWRLRCAPPAAIIEGDGAADCSVTLSTVDFIELMEKRLNPQMAFLSGRIKLTGDVTLALKLAELM